MRMRTSLRKAFVRPRYSARAREKKLHYATATCRDPANKFTRSFASCEILAMSNVRKVVEIVGLILASVFLVAKVLISSAIEAPRGVGQALSNRTEEISIRQSEVRRSYVAMWVRV